MYSTNAGQSSPNLTKEPTPLICVLMHSLRVNLIDPQSVDDFQTISTIAKLYPGTSCMEAPNFSSLGLAAGAPVTFMTSFTVGPALA